MSVTSQDNLAGVDWRPLTEFERLRWQPASDWRFVSRLACIPLSDTEILKTSHFLPIVIRLHGGNAQVVTLLGETPSTARLVGSEGAWLGPYVPIALRCMPLALSEEGSAADIRVARNFGLTDAEATEESADNVASVVRTLKMLEAGQAKAAIHAEALLAADVCRKIRGAPIEDPVEAIDGFYTVDVQKFGERSPLALSISARSSFAPIELAFACMFSARLLGADAIAYEQGTSSSVLIERASDLEDMIRSVAPIPVRLDDGATLNVAEFLTNGSYEDLIRAQ